VLRILGEKDLIRYKEDGPRYIYHPAQDTEAARDDVLAHVVRTYFAGSPEQAVTALLRMSDVDMTDGDVERLRERIRRARQSGR
jgi:BlaI family penicillinase repressor